MEKTVVGIAEGKVVKAPGELITYALGSCVGICLYDRTSRVAGMVHILLPYKKSAVNQSNPYKFADTGIAMLVKDMEQCGANVRRMTAKIAGGAEMFERTDTFKGKVDETQIGQRNVEATREVLRGLRIPVIADDTGDRLGRTITFSAETGQLTVKTVRWEWKKL